MLDIVYAKSAQKQLKNLDKKLQQKVFTTMNNFVAGKPVNLKKLKGYDDTYRIRINDYRIVFEVILLDNMVCVIRIAHRKDVYENL